VGVERCLSKTLQDLRLNRVRGSHRFVSRKTCVAVELVEQRGGTRTLMDLGMYHKEVRYFVLTTR